VVEVEAEARLGAARAAVVEPGMAVAVVAQVAGAVEEGAVEEGAVAAAQVVVAAAQPKQPRRECG
jgi:hypothetical protein